MLVVDDNRDHLDMEIRLCKREFPQVTFHAVTDAAEAVQLADQKKWDLVLTDLNLASSMTGIDVARAAQLQGSPVVMVTAWASLLEDFLVIEKDVGWDNLKRFLGTLH